MRTTLFNGSGKASLVFASVFGVVYLATASLALAQSAPPPGLNDPKGRGKTIEKCEKEIKKTSLKFASKKLKSLQKCVDAIFKCVQTKPGDDKCLEKARATCEKEFTKIGQEEEKAKASIDKKCAEIALNDLQEDAGMGFGGSARCTGSTYEEIRDCMVSKHECMVERLLGKEVPRAAALMTAVGLDPSAFSCLEGTGGDDGTTDVGDPKGRGKEINKCQAAIKKAAGKFVAKKLKGIQKCVNTVYKCVQLKQPEKKPGDFDKCMQKASEKCAKEFDKINGGGKTTPEKSEVGKLRAAIFKGCVKAMPEDILNQPGIWFGRHADQCDSFGVSSLNGVDDLMECVYRQHECVVDEMMLTEVPRSEELLQAVNQSLDNIFPCPNLAPPTTTTTSTSSTSTSSSTTTSTSSTTSTTQAAVCGNGTKEGAEDCDDGNTLDGDCCSANCTFEAAQRPCTDDGEVCTDDVCDGAGTCTHPNNTAQCDDGKFCNGVDVCSGGICTHPGDPCASGGECNKSCDEAKDNCFDPAGTACTGDTNICTDDICDGAGTCAHPNNTASCDDGLFCNGTDVCSNGACIHDGDPCASGGECNKSCNETTDKCFDPAGTACTDDGNVCTDDKCDGAGQCTHPNNTAACDDGDPCTVGDQCDRTGTCVAGPNDKCGDNTLDIGCGEECDGTDQGDCTAGCTSNCTCVPAPVCGDDNLDPGEACDPPGSATCPGLPGEAPTICGNDCQCACPTEVSFEGDPTANALDTGFTGQSHDAKVVGDGILTVAIGNCDSPVRPCGQCEITDGPVRNHEKANNQRCNNNTSVECTDDTPCFQQCVGGGKDGTACSSDTDCPGGGACQGPGSCEFYFGGPLPLSAGAVPACVTNEINGTVTGTVNIEAGSSDSKVRLISRVFNGVVADKPCPTCEGDVTPFDGVRDGSCNAGARDGLSCDVTGETVFFGSTSFDCPLEPGANIGNLDILLEPTTGTQTKNITAASPKCTAPGFKGLKCMCNSCSTAEAEPCFSDADCPTGATCGGKRCQGGAQNGAPCSKASDCDSNICTRPGEATLPNRCTGGATDCVQDLADTDSVDEGHCLSGPFDPLCEIETFRGCTIDADCPLPGDGCGSKIRECFTTDGTTTGDTDVKVAGVPDPPVNDLSNPTLGTLFCISPTSSSAVNSVSGLPGLGRLSLPGTAKAF